MKIAAPLRDGVPLVRAEAVLEKRFAFRAASPILALR